VKRKMLLKVYIIYIIHLVVYGCVFYIIEDYSSHMVDMISTKCYLNVKINRITHPNLDLVLNIHYDVINMHFIQDKAMHALKCILIYHIKISKYFLQISNLCDRNWNRNTWWLRILRRTRRTRRTILDPYKNTLPHSQSFHHHLLYITLQYIW